MNNIISFTVASDGTTGPEWIMRLEKGGYRVSDWAKELLNSKDFKPTKGTVEVKVIKATYFTDDKRITKNIRKEAKKLGFETPNAEIACLIREKFSDKELESMGLWYIVTMHNPIKDSDGYPDLLCACRGDDGRWLHACWGYPDYDWSDDGAFAFVVPQVGAKNLEPSSQRLETLDLELSEIIVNGKKYRLVNN